jgi:hypothetical protein
MEVHERTNRVSEDVLNKSFELKKMLHIQRIVSFEVCIDI